MLTFDNLPIRAKAILTFIDEKWEDLRANARHGHQDRFSDWEALAATSKDGHLDDLDPQRPYILFLPNDFVTPGGRFMVQFYWDSYFVVKALICTERFELAKGIVENCLFLADRHGMVIANRKRWAAGSQLPFLSEMVREVYNTTRDKKWLAWAASIVEREFIGYWLNSDHLAYEGLSRYHAPPCYPAENIADITMDHEASWDLSPRFDRGDVLELLPVDLNSNLYAYEMDLAVFHEELDSPKEASLWRNRAEQRARAVNALMWDSADGIYYDFNFVTGQRKKVKSMATFFPLFRKIASREQARTIAEKIELFEREYGMAACDQSYGYIDRQWNYPVGWPPLHLVSYLALKSYGHMEIAGRIALKWLNLNLRIWEQTGKLFEKYDVEIGSAEVLEDRYKNQDGFAWTNATFLYLLKDLAAGSKLSVQSTG
ncbi:alpha,alpha-trehalase [Silvibacterium bohemicum]|uniref:Alpha,alpha-trehalase n=1 Tax=Silvibacterium bohemicum TaxID=1577686 RepID=A0A841K441_9BACT|nr:trehalase family glycosidase [Silvibacterium bohemicum]MBB6145398.1 alpha,alpha-trehalase [Silvibacterium bohemicum]